MADKKGFRGKKTGRTTKGKKAGKIIIKAKKTKK